MKAFWDLELSCITQQASKRTRQCLNTQISHLQCGQRYPGPCPHCPLCWAAIQNGSGTSQTQQVSAIPCQNVLLEHNEHDVTLYNGYEVHNIRLAVDGTGFVPASLGFWYFCEVVIPVAVTCGQHSLMNKIQNKKTTLSKHKRGL